MKCLKDGFLRHIRAIKAGLTLTIFSKNRLIDLYSKYGFLQEARKLFDEMPERNVFSWNAVISAYVRSRNLNEAFKLFKEAETERDLVTYNTLLSGFAASDGHEDDAIEMFVGMQRQEKNGIWIDEFSITTMLNLCAKLSNAFYGEQLHGLMVKTGNDGTGFAVSSLIDMYSKCGCFKEACLVFDCCGGKVVDAVAKNTMVAACCREGNMERASRIFWTNPELNDTVSWNTMISGYAQNGYEEASLRMFVSMKKNACKLNDHTIAGVLSVLSSLKSLKLGKEVHAWVLKNGSYSNPFISSGIVDVYCNCGNMKDAEAVHSLYGCGNLYSVSPMIVGYSSWGNMLEARRLFDSLSEKNRVVWTAIFSGYLKSQDSNAMFELFREYIAKETEVPNSLIMVRILGACSLQATLDLGKQIHAYILRTGILMERKLASSLIDMYSKCGNIKYAERVFIEITERDTVIYNSMVAGYAHHGHDVEAFQLFDDMTANGFRPDEITFMALLSACRHGGLVKTGEKYFSLMIELYSIRPEVDHYACMIDLYGRASRLDKAVELVNGIQAEEDAVIFGVFLNACKMNKNSGLAKEAEEKLLNIDGYNGSRHIQLANVYASEGKWDEMQRIRRHMRGKELKKFAGCSWIHIDKWLHVFTSFDVSHVKKEAIYSMLHFLTKDLPETAEFDGIDLGPSMNKPG